MNLKKLLLFGIVCFLASSVSLSGQTRRSIAPSQVRTYYIAAEEVDWDYAPSGIDKVREAPFVGLAQNFLETGDDRIGHVYRKAIYREYTDASFRTRKPRTADWEHLGILGPLIQAQVGDTVKILFHNKGTRPYSMHPHGVFYNKDSEGAGSNDGTRGADRADDAVEPGKEHLYIWAVPERAGPAMGDPSAILWMYHSHVNEEGDVNAGLMGPMIITRRGKLGRDNRPVDVDREVVVMFAELDENTSLFAEENIKRFAKKPESINRFSPSTFADPFYLSNLKETINGFVFGNGPQIVLHKGERVRWYIMANTNFEIHAPHWHGNTVTVMHMRTDVLPLMPMGMFAADMVPDNLGSWLFHCHVAPHLNAGMTSLYKVVE